MEKITGKVRLQYQKKKYIVAYEIDDMGIVCLDKSKGFDNEVYERAMLKIMAENESVIDDRWGKGSKNNDEDVTEIEKVTKNIDGPKNEKDEEILLLQKKLEELERENERLRQRSSRGGRPSIGETRKVSLTLPTHIWRDIDVAVRVGKMKQSEVLREMIVRAHEAQVFNWKDGF
jgi:hypothetical protein